MYLYNFLLYILQQGLVPEHLLDIFQQRVNGLEEVLDGTDDMLRFYDPNAEVGDWVDDPNAEVEDTFDDGDYEADSYVDDSGYESDLR